MFRSFSGETIRICNLEHDLPDFKINTFRVHAGSVVSGKSLTDLMLRKRYRVSILAIRRGKETLVNPGGEDLLLPDDQVIVSGDMRSILAVIPVFSAPPHAEQPGRA